MFIWIIITIIAHLLNAIVFILDKHLVSKSVLKPVSYAFYSGVFQIFALVLIPFSYMLPDGFVLPETRLLIAGFAIGALFILALLVFYEAIQSAEASRVVPVVGGMVPVFTFFLAYVFLGERLNLAQAIAFAFFIAGGFILSTKFISRGRALVIKELPLALLAAFIFAVYYIGLKFIFLNLSFWSGFVVLQIGGFLGSLVLLFFPGNRRLIFDAPTSIKKEDASLFLPNKILAAIAAFLLYFAVSLQGSSVTIINSLQAVQYAFLLIFAIVLSKTFPSFFSEQISREVLVQKVFAIVLIGVGLALFSL